MNSRTLTRSRCRTGAPGFSLLELMLVIAIIGILMAIVAVNVLGAGDRAKRTATVASLRTIKNVMGEYILKYSSPPPTLDTLVQLKYLDPDFKLEDGWKRPFIYNPRGLDKDHPYTLGSGGPDSTTTDDDVDVWNLSKE